MYVNRISPDTNYDSSGNVRSLQTTEQSDLSDFDSSSNLLSIPDALVSYARNTIFSTWQILETQLQQVDPAKEPEVYLALNDRANTLFNSWLQFRFVGQEA